jgi:hypothetical protein
VGDVSAVTPLLLPDRFPAASTLCPVLAARPDQQRHALRRNAPAVRCSLLTVPCWAPPAALFPVPPGEDELREISRLTKADGTSRAKPATHPRTRTRQVALIERKHRCRAHSLATCRIAHLPSPSPRVGPVPLPPRLLWH